ncbi:MAG: cytochrome c [Thermoflavifilum sp.]|nr:cytochrome c [Thermoflavifilum sp.]
MKKGLNTLLFLIIGFGFVACNSSSQKGRQAEESSSAISTASAPTNPLDDKGVGPIQSVQLGAIQPELVKKGEAIFNEKCTACHRLDSRYIGPALKGVTKRQAPEWIMNMILNPDVMIQQDPIAKQLVSESNGAVMANLHLSEEDARALLEYLRAVDDSSSSQ